ncbi:MAG TPA: hypothetical protein VGZ00_12625 [Candidatus Baltobacteraceae bacterium]|jgi:hypothetical protein|nr:hypothetical protein [Candidatus Baltobacteraceae bacterium]
MGGILKHTRPGRLRPFLAIVMLFALAGCAGSSSSSGPGDLVDEITRAVYQDDYARTVLHFDDAAKATVTRASLGDLSDRMHRLGSYSGLGQKAADPDKMRYVYELRFDRGTATAELRIDGDGKVGAYRVLF